MTMKFERVSTGVIGLDEKIEGGLVKGSINFLTGKTGTGKTAFCSSFLYVGAKNGKRSLYVTTEEREEDIKNDIRAMFDWDIDSLERMGLLKFMSLRPELPMRVVDGDEAAKVVKLYMFDMISKIEGAVRNYGIERLVVDSVSIVEAFIKDDYLRKIALMQLIDRLKDLNVTAVLTGIVPEGSEVLSSSGIIEFLTDSVLKLDFVPIAEEFKRTLNVRKMRRTDHSVLIHPFEITKNGVRVIEIKED